MVRWHKFKTPQRNRHGFTVDLDKIEAYFIKYRLEDIVTIIISGVEYDVEIDPDLAVILISSNRLTRLVKLGVVD